MKKRDEEMDDQKWFNDQFKDKITRFDDLHAPLIPSSQQFDELVHAHKQERSRKLWKELLLFWITACFVFGLMLWIIERNWVWFAILQTIVAAGGMVFASMAFSRRRQREWKS
ncbi:YxlC family protein [Paenibacillus sinopodophylli]|uniref:YxlC family protein n=1 Tax=Paenibacillus sinopodophylli TaxID=1837342 RepID=UPI00110CB28B|nr:YxlC family protein [Paenibacillus sinopodophylli]